jgi:hypothetical protein
MQSHPLAIADFFALSLFAFCAPSLLAQPLPDDSRAYQLLAVTMDPPTPACRSLLAALDSPELAPIRSAAKVFRFPATDPLYLQRYGDALPPETAPVLSLVRADGGVLYKASGEAIPSNPAALAEALTEWASADIASTGRPQLLPGRPRLIPDTVTITPTLSLPPEALTAALIALALLGLGLAFAVTVFAALAYYFFW